LAIEGNSAIKRSVIEERPTKKIKFGLSLQDTGCLTPTKSSRDPLFFTTSSSNADETLGAKAILGDDKDTKVNSGHALGHDISAEQNKENEFEQELRDFLGDCVIFVD
jgi:hypothetical protein